MRRAQRRVLIGVGIAGVLQGLLWALLAPGVPYKVLADGRYGALPSTTSYHFVALALFCWLGLIVGVLTAVLAWRSRVSRGWPMLLTVVGASFAGALLAWGLGRLVAPGTDPASIGASAADSIVVSAAATGTILAVLAQPAAAALTYTVLVAWNGRPDLSVPATPPPTDCRQSA